MLVVLYDIQIPLYNKCVVIDRYITCSLIREVFQGSSSMFSESPQLMPQKTFENIFEHAPRFACLFQ
jgi:hypothetical protein